MHRGGSAWAGYGAGKGMLVRASEGGKGKGTVPSHGRVWGGGRTETQHVAGGAPPPSSPLSPLAQLLTPSAAAALEGAAPAEVVAGVPEKVRPAPPPPTPGSAAADATAAALAATGAASLVAALVVAPGSVLTPWEGVEWGGPGTAAVGRTLLGRAAALDPAAAGPLLVAPTVERGSRNVAAARAAYAAAAGSRRRPEVSSSGPLTKGAGEGGGEGRGGAKLVRCRPERRARGGAGGTPPRPC